MGDSTVVENIEKISIEAAVDDDFVDPWNVSSKSDAGLDYDKLISKHCINIIMNCNNITSYCREIWQFQNR